MEIEQQQAVVYAQPETKKLGFWAKFGGASFTIAVLIHILLGILAAIWIAQRIYPPEKKIDFLPGGGEAGGQGRAPRQPARARGGCAQGRGRDEREPIRTLRNRL
jgi:hypothetical protein